MEDVKKVARTTMLTPELITAKLFGFYLKAHLYHWNNKSIGQHLLLNDLYPKLVELNDEITEYMLGVQIPKRYAPMNNVEQPGEYSEANLMKFLEDGFQFSVQLCDYAEGRELEELCNLASELQQAFAKAKLFTTYK